MENYPFRHKKLRSPLPRNVSVKWSREVLDEGFIPFPKRLLRSMADVFSGAHAIEDLAVVLSVADYNRPDLQRPPSLKYLAFNAGMSAEHFGVRLRDLENRRLVQREGPDEEVTIKLDPLLAVITSHTAEDSE